MKSTFLLLISFLLSTALFAQNATEVTRTNSWFKIGLNAGVPVGKASNYSSFLAGLELKGQLMETKNWGIGATTGYSHYFVKMNMSSFGAIPLGGFVRYYPNREGIFAGVDAGYSFLVGKSVSNGGMFLKPQIGYHNYNWNYFAYFNNIFRANNKGGSIGNVGIGATYNIRFHKK